MNLSTNHPWFVGMFFFKGEGLGDPPPTSTTTKRPEKIFGLFSRMVGLKKIHIDHRLGPPPKGKEGGGLGDPPRKQGGGLALDTGEGSW